jgi:hypothetical protein
VTLPPRPAQTVLAALLLSLLLTGCGHPAPGSTVTTSRAAVPAGTTAPATRATHAAAACPAEAGCPRPEVTPGTVVGSAAGVCTTGYNPRRELTAAAKRRVLARYGLGVNAYVAEWDHLVARWAGGTSTSGNVWPQTRPAAAQRKDALEYRLYVAVCQRRMLPLTEARDRMRTFWRWW